MMQQLQLLQKESIDMNIAFLGDRYEQERKKKMKEIEDWNIRRKNH